MTKPTIVTRASKGSALTWTEGDSNLTNLRDATVTIKADTGGTDVVSDLNGTVTLVAGTNVTITGDNTAKTVTINSTASGGATNLDGLSDVAITAATTGDILRYDGSNWVDTAESSITVGTASVGSTVTLTNDESTNATNYPLFVNATTGNLSPRTDSGLTYNPSTGILGTTGKFSKTGGASGSNPWATGAGIVCASGTYTDTTSTGTMASANINLFNTPTFAASNALTITDAINLNLGAPTAGTNVTITNAYALSANSNIRLTNNSMLRFSGATGFYTSLKAGTLAADTTYTLPTAYPGTNGYILSSTTAGVLSWTAPSTGTVTSVAALTLGTTGTDVSSTVATGTTTPVITLNIPTASATNRGALSSTDWSTFNGKQDALVSGTNIKTINSTSLLGSGDITVSASAAGSNQQIQFNNAGALGASSGLYYDGTSLRCSSGNIESLYSNGDEGGEFRLATATTNTTLAGGSVAIDIYQNRLRIFETGGSTRGVYLDLTGAANTVGSALAVQGTAASFSTLTSTGSLTFKDTREAVYDLGTTGGTIAPNPANGSVQKITLNSALTINAFTSPVAGQSLTLIIYGGTAYTSITSTMKFAGGSKTLTGTAGCIDILTVYYDGTNYFASLGKGYA